MLVVTTAVIVIVVVAVAAVAVVAAAVVATSLPQNAKFKQYVPAHVACCCTFDEKHNLGAIST